MFGLVNRLFSGQKKPVRKATFKPQVENLEVREVMAVSVLSNVVAPIAVFHLPTPPPPTPTAAGLALIDGLPNTPVRSAALTDYTRDGMISRDDMMDILNQGTSGYTSATVTEYTSLLTLVNNGPKVDMPSYVQYLASKTLTAANAELQADIRSMALEHLSAVLLDRFIVSDGPTRAQYILAQVDNYFLGEVHPNASYVSNGQTITPAYEQVNLPLFNGTPTYQDVAQGALGDCWLMASLAEVADRDPALIENMFINNGDGTYTVRLYDGKTPEYVTVDSYLPNGGGLYDHPQADMWAALAEKAYVQENGAGLVTSGHVGVDSYQALNNGWPQWALSAITGLSAASTSNMNGTNIATAWADGKFVVMCSDGSPSSSLVVPSHCYAMVNYSSGWITLYNPWGTAGGYSGDNGKYYPGMIEASTSGLSDNFSSWADVAAAVPAPQAVQTGATSPSFLLECHYRLQVDDALLSALSHRGTESTQAFSDTTLRDILAGVD